jgi:hypothetical protein
MATITWTSTSAANWNTPAAWSGGVVPGANDTAVFTSAANGGGSGNCTLDGDFSVLDFKLLTEYAGTFNYNGRKLKVGNNGQGICHIFKEVADSSNATLDLYCGDVILVSQHVLCTFYASCDLRLGGYGHGKAQINTEKTVTFRRSKHPDYAAFTPLTYYYVPEGRFDIYGILDMSEADRIHTYYRSSMAQLHFTSGVIRNTSGDVKTIKGERSGSLSVGRLEGLFNLDWDMFGTTIVIQGDLLQFADIQMSTYMNASTTNITLTNAIFDRLKFTANHAANMTVTLPEASEIHGDVIVTQNGAGAVTLQKSGGGTPAFAIAGTNDQQLSVLNNTVNITANKLAGKTTFLTGIYELQNNATFTDGLEFSATFSGMFYANEWDITTEGDIDSSNAAGLVRFGKLLLKGEKNQSIKFSENTNVSNMNITKPNSGDVTCSLTKLSTGYIVGYNICKTLINDASYIVIGDGAIIDCIYHAKGDAYFTSDGNGTWRARGMIRQPL